MQVQQDVMNNFLSSTNTGFVIPVYQRNYAWSEENCIKLLEDIVSISGDLSKTHFMGTITYIIHHVPLENGIGNRQEYVIIDGQQRITSIMLLLKALQDKINDERIKQVISRNINDDTTINRLRLKPIKKDFEAFDCVMNGRAGDYSGDSAMKKNYQCFKEELDYYISKGHKPEDIYGAFLRLKLVAIGLVKGEDDPQVVFESINATGVQLKGVDLVRNYLLMGEDSKEQERLYDEYWKPIEDKHITRAKELEDFLEHYLRIYQGVEVKKDDVYFWFKKLSKEQFKDRFEELMADMLDYAKIYRVFLKDSNFKFTHASHKEDEILRRKISIIVGLKFGVSYPFIMKIIRDFEEGKLDFENLKSILNILVSYYVRRQICGLTSNALNKVMYGLYDRIKGADSVLACDLAYHLGKKSGRELFPDDLMLNKHFADYNAYSSNFICRFVLFEIEKLSNVDLRRDEDLTIEHFYPQRPEKSWRELVGDYQLLESSYLHTFGNLTLTGQNLQLSNKPFDEKVELLLEKGSLHLNEYLTNMTSWGIDEIQKRSEFLADKFCEVDLFKDLPKECRHRSMSLTMADDLTHCRLLEVRFPNGNTAPAKNAKQLATEVISYLYQNHRDGFEEYLNDAPDCIVWDSAKAKSRDKQGSISIEFKKGGFYFVSSTSLRDVGNHLKKFIHACGLNPQDFILE